MGETLFGKQNDLTRSEKTKISRKATNTLTAYCIDYLNKSGAFIAWRQNNIPSTRSETIIKADGTTETKFHFKKGQIKFKLLDIAAVQIGTAKYFELEVKTGKDTLSEGQRLRITELNKSGAVAFVFDSKETFLMQIKKHLDNKPLAF